MRTTLARLVRTLPTIALVAAVIAGIVIAPEAMLMMGPAALLLALLAGGVRPGERILERLSRRRRSKAPRRRTALARPHVMRMVRRTRQPLSPALAMRPPPAHGVSCS